MPSGKMWIQLWRCEGSAEGAGKESVGVVEYAGREEKGSVIWSVGRRGREDCDVDDDDDERERKGVAGGKGGEESSRMHCVRVVWKSPP